MAADYTSNNIPAFEGGRSSVIPSHKSVRNAPLQRYSVVLEDDAAFNLGAYEDSVWIVKSSADIGVFQVKANGTVAVIVGNDSANVAATDSDGDLCFINASGELVIKNRLGSEQTVSFARIF